jgi:hypothetical protein
VSKYELFGASKEEKFPPKFLQANINKEKTALQKAVEVRIVFALETKTIRCYVLVTKTAIC